MVTIVVVGVVGDGEYKLAEEGFFGSGGVTGGNVEFRYRRSAVGHDGATKHSTEVI